MAPGRPKGTPKTGGRQKGVPNKAPIARAKAIEASGLTPLEFMVQCMRNEAMPEDFRLDAAKAAAPYVHPKLTSVELKGDPNAPIEHHLTIDAFTSRIARLSARNTEDARDPDAEPGGS
jgi:hypothetical protein